VAHCDVIVANMRPDALARLHLDAKTIRARYPDKIHCLITGYGTDGPYAGLPTYDSVLQGASGIAGLFEARDGKPAYMPMLICDHVVGEIAAGAILAALHQRQKTAQGASLEIPMFETMATMVLQEHLAQQSFDPPVGPPGDLRLLSPHNHPVKTQDGYFSFTINTDAQVQTFLRVTEREALLSDPRFQTVASRAEHVFAWFEVRGAALESKTTDQWIAIFRAADLPAMPCHTLATLPLDPHLVAVGLLGHEQHPTEGKVATIRSTVRVDDTYAALRSPAMPLGWHTRALLLDLGYTVGEVEVMLAERAVVGVE
jgi:crotonobetainyl-CoA:carnitine CoA-transferase CaiB-like acyl-CoA transferase